jgi:hypothetical protein
VLSPAEQTLRELGITQPKDIDVEAIAWCLGARVKFRPLDQCEARIVGNGDNAIITVNNRSSWQRMRFSIAHELGHWKYHRGRILVCREDEIGRSGINYPSLERTADMFASQLLMPGFLFDAAARSKKLTFQTITAVAGDFDTSIKATAIRLVEGKHALAILICHGLNGRKWFTRSPGVPDRWFPQEQLDSESFAFDVLFGKKPNDPMPRKIGADAWFDREEAARYEVTEQSFHSGKDEILSLIVLSDEKMLEDWESSRPSSYRRR